MVLSVLPQRIFVRLRRALAARVRAALCGLLALATSFGAFTPAAAASGLAAVDLACADADAPDACDDGLGRILQVLIAAQSQLIQEEDEHPPRDAELASALAPTRAGALPEPLLLEGEDLSPSLLRPPRSIAA